jgi:hypothetical protein
VNSDLSQTTPISPAVTEEVPTSKRATRLLKQKQLSREEEEGKETMVDII